MVRFWLCFEQPCKIENKQLLLGKVTKRRLLFDISWFKGKKNLWLEITQLSIAFSRKLI